MANNPYEILGVDSKASDEEIKSAFRFLSKSRHPDRGGNPLEFAKLVDAYRLLTSPSMRLLYDNTGEDQRAPEDVEIRAILMEAFKFALSPEVLNKKYLSGKHGSELVMANAKLFVDGEANRIKQDKNRLIERKQLLTRLHKRIKTKGKINVAHIIIDEEVRVAQLGIGECKYQLELAQKACAALREYEQLPPNVAGFLMADLLGGSMSLAQLLELDSGD